MKTFSAIILFLFTITAIGDGVLQSVSGTTALAGSTITGTVLTNNSTIGWTNTVNIQSATLNTTSWLSVGSNQTNAGNIIPDADNTRTLGNPGKSWNSINVKGNAVLHAIQGDSGATTIYPSAAGTFKFGTSFGTDATIIATNFQGNTLWVTNGIGSWGVSTITTSATGATNTTTVNQLLYVTAATSVTLKDNAGTTEFSGVTIAAFTPVRLQPGGTFIGTSIVYATGTASHAE